jgi:hypothetical protein
VLVPSALNYSNWLCASESIELLGEHLFQLIETVGSYHRDWMA